MCLLRQKSSCAPASIRTATMSPWWARRFTESAKPDSSWAAVGSQYRDGVTAQPLPTTLRLAVWLLTAEAAALVLLAVVLLYGDLTEGAGSQHAAIGVIGYVSVIAAVFAVLAWALSGRKAWARGPAIVLHMLLLPFGIASAAGGQALVGLVVLVASLAGLTVLLAPATRVAIGRDD